MYVMIITLLCITHLSITASEQAQPQTPTSPRELDTPRPETPSDDHVVRVHRRQSSLKSLAALSIPSTTRSSISSLEPSSPKSSVELSSTAPLVVRTESPKQTTPIRISPKNEQEDPNRRLFPSMYLTNFHGRIPAAEIVEDESRISCGFFTLCSVCCLGTLAGIVLAIIAGAKGGNPFN